MSKEIRRRETDCIKTFVEYAAAQGGKHAARYYISFSKLADNAAGIDNRERATVLQLNALLMAETMIEREIKRGISCGNPYPSIYSACKVDQEVSGNPASNLTKLDSSKEGEPLNLQDFLSRLDGVKGHNNQYSAKCPAHDDHNASLSVSTGKDGKSL